MEDCKTRENLYHISRKRCSVFLVWACFLLFVTMMASKNVYTAELVTLVDVFGKTKAQVSVAMTYYFIVYAIMQIILSVILPKINIRIYLTITAGISAILTMLIAIGNLDLIYVLCTINGALQAGVFAGCMSVISKYLTKNLLPFANVVMSVGTPVSSMISYGSSALFVGLGRWELPFIILGACFFIAVALFFLAVTLMKRFPPEVVEDHGRIVVAHEEKPFVALPTKKDKGIFITLILFIVLMSNCAHYATMNWLPSMLKDLFGMPDSYSILITLIAPIIMFIFSFITIYACERVSNILIIFAIFSFIALVAFMPLLIIYDFNIISTLVLLIMFIGFASAARTVLASIMSFKMRSQINSGSYSAATNAMASIGAGVMPTIAGTIIDGSGYQPLFLTVMGVFVACLIAFVVLFLFVMRRRGSK